MQTLYSLETLENPVPPADAIKLLQKQFDLSRQLVVFFTYCLTEVARYAETDAKNKAAKHLPSQEDLRVNTKISGNDLLWKILELPTYQQALIEDKPQLTGDPALIRKIYIELKATDKYQHYINVGSRDKREEKQILEFILSDLLLPNENFINFIEEKFPNWDDDADMVNLLLTNLLGKPLSFNFQELISPDKWEFAKELLRTTIEKKELAMEYIKPKLKNWDAERIAVLDMLLMRLGVCEFLFFETIPPKVTINEYIDLAKEYSTQQSGQFINGILDSIHKDLVREEKMHKVAFKPL